MVVQRCERTSFAMLVPLFIFLMIPFIHGACNPPAPFNGAVCISNIWHFNGTLLLGATAATQSLMLSSSQLLSVTGGDLLILAATTVSFFCDLFNASAIPVVIVSDALQLAGTMNFTATSRPPFGTTIIPVFSASSVVGNFQTFNIFQNYSGFSCDVLSLSSISNGTIAWIQLQNGNACSGSDPAPLYIVMGICGTIILVSVILFVYFYYTRSR